MTCRTASNTIATPKLSIGKRLWREEPLKGPDERERAAMWVTLATGKSSTEHKLRILFAASNPLGSAKRVSLVVGPCGLYAASVSCSGLFAGLGTVGGGVGDKPPPCCFRVVFVSYSGSFAGLGGAGGSVGGYATSVSFSGHV